MVEDRGPQLQAVGVTFVSMALIATCLRCYTRRLLMKSAFSVEDWLMVFSTLSFVMFTACAIAGVHYGTGRHFSDLSNNDIFMAMRYWWLCYIAYCLTMIAVKLSIGLLLLRLTINKIHRRILYTVMALSVLTGVVFFFVTIFQCTPVSFFWNRAQPGTCIDVHILEGLTYLYSSINAINDFTFGLLPVALIYNLQMDRKTKLLLIPILSMGCIASAAILVRMAYVQEFSNPDFLWATVDIAIWSDTEQGLAITAGCLATLRPLFWHISRRLGWTSVGPSNGPSDGRRYPSRIRRRTPGPFSLITLTNGIHGDASDENLQMDDQKALEAQEKMGTTTVICAERRGERTGRFRIEKWDEAETPVSRESIGLAA